MVGAGSGGLTVAIGLANLGRTVALVEGRHVGGDCTNVGCVPSKTLIHLARGGVEGAAALAETRRKRDALRDRETMETGHIANLDLIHGWAVLAGPRSVHVTDQHGGSRTLEAQHVVVATGSRPNRIAVAGLPAERAVTNESVFELERAPEHLAIIGAGVIGLELAFAFRRLGSQVTVLTHGGRALPAAIPEASVVLEQALAAAGIAFLAHAKVQRYDQANSALELSVRGAAHQLTGVDQVLLATGRQRATDSVGLATAGVTLKHGAVITDSFGQTDVPGVFAVGDVTETSKFTHSANAQGRRVVQRIAFPWLPAFGAEPLYPSATFSEPEVASVGMSQHEIARRFHHDAIIRLRFDLKDLDRGYTDGVERGFVLVEALRLTGRILSATIVGPMASEMISLFTLAISERITLWRLYRLVYPYPTYSNAIGKVADAFVRATLPRLQTELAAFVRYRFARPVQPDTQGTSPQRNEETKATKPKDPHLEGTI